MFDRNSAVELLRDLPWEEGLKHRIIEGPYRHSLEIVCSSHGRKKAVFADGKEHGYFSYMRISSTGIGAHVVPVLPDGRLLMVVEQRPPQDYPGESRQLPMVNGRPLSLDKYGPYSSLEFPGGGIEPGESVKIGALREMLEETGVAEQEIQLYRTITPHFLFGSDTTSRNFHAVAFLAKDIYEKWVPTDGGLHVFAFHPTEVLRNIQRGAIVSGQAVIMPWFFYEKVMAIRHRRGGYGWDELITDEMVKLA